MATPDHNTLLDQLQSNVNLVLEQSGRVFAAMAEDSSKPPTAQINKLKQIVPKAHGDFNDALDSLEEKLVGHRFIQFAQWVMRRDLALWRERAGLPEQSTTEQQPVQSPVPPPQPVSTSMQDTSTPAPTTPHVETATASSEDVAMEDAQPEQQPSTGEQPKMDVDMADDTIAIKTGTPLATSEPAVETQASQDLTTQTSAKSTSPNAKKPEPALQVDTAPDTTKSTKPSEDDKAPDTAKECVKNDLDSLFDGGDVTNDPNNEFNFDEATNGDLDFGDFTNFGTDNGDNDNISSLLPGLEDYANTQTNNSSGAELDLNSFFNTDAGDANNTSNDKINNDNQHDTTFEDLMNLNFDGPGMDDADNTADLDFDSLFN
ncbi:hypothetical protein Slin14017_G118640 [Septoria linicola]|nr:hypothetical protein Slin14017_G118640 [Septoria linicola]